jgi:hypothetical protein
LRSVLIILTWYFLINPLVLKGLKSWLEKRRKTAAIDIDRVMLLLPSTHYILTKGWQLSASKTGLNRLKEYCKIVLVNTLK